MTERSLTLQAAEHASQPLVGGGWQLLARRARVREIGEAAGVAAAAGAAYGAGAPTTITMLVASAAALAVAALREPLALLCGFILLRPLLDRFTSDRLDVGPLHVNLAGGVGVLFIVLTAFVLRRQRIVWTRISTTFAIVVGVSILAALYGLVELHAVLGSKPVEEVVRLVTLACAYVLGLNVVSTRERVRIVGVTICVSALIPSLTAITETARGGASAIGLNVHRAIGTFEGPNPLGEYLALAALVLLFMPPAALQARRRVVLGAPIFAALLGTFSRSGWIIFAVGLVALGWRDHRRMLAVAAVGTAVVIAASPTVRERVLSPSSSTGPFYQRWVPSSYRWRIDTWRGVAEKYAHKPLTGYGLRSGPFVNPRQSVTPNGVVGYDPHNSALKLLLEGGPILLAAWVALFAAAIRRLRSLASQSELRRWSRIALWMWAAVALLGVASDDVLASTALLAALFAFTGALDGAARSTAAAKPT